METEKIEVAFDEKIKYIERQITKTRVDSAMLDGCTKEQAKLVAIGIDISEEFQLPPLGWYKFITPDEMLIQTK